MTSDVNLNNDFNTKYLLADKHQSIFEQLKQKSIGSEIERDEFKSKDIELNKILQKLENMQICQITYQ